MNKLLLAALCIAAATPVTALAEAGDWVVRVRAAHISPNEDSELGKTVNKNIAPVMNPGAELDVKSNTIPELDISYYFTKNIAAELILALGTRHDVYIKGDAGGVIGNQKLGSVNLLPPTLTAQWHFNPDQMIDPYIGAGINYTLSLDKKARGTRGAIAGEEIEIGRHSFGYALQTGVDVNLKDGWLINADVKYLYIDTDVRLRSAITGGWTKVDSLDIHPWVISIGIGKKF